ncbi:MAG: domain containing protein [Bacteroidetes bacterium]|jgi:PKD repeat protein|nr:domain containing protein [Bacteroidota bacterium]
MKLFRYIIILVFSLGMIISCKKKKYPESKTENQPPFYFTADINNTPVNLAAGVDGYYMYSSYIQGPNNVYGFIANLRKPDSLYGTYPNSLYIKINDSKVTAFGAPVTIDSALAPKPYPILAGASYSAQFQSFYNKTASSYMWNFGDGQTSNQPNPSHVYTKQGKYNVSLTVIGTSGCVSSMSYVQKIGFPATSCIATATANATGGNTISFSSNAQGTMPFGRLWNFGDGTTSTSANPVHTYAFGGSYPVSLRVIDGNNDTSWVKLNVVTQADVSSCSTNFLVNTVTTAPSLDLSNITITWTDASGVVYSSSNYQQPASSYFQIVSVENFDKNENNELTKKIKVKFRCNVYNGTLVKLIDNAEATICVAYK